MSKLFSLLKATMSEGLQLFSYRGKTEHSRRIMPIVLAALIGMLMLFSATTMVSDFKEDGAVSTILSIYTLVTTMVILMEGSYKSGDLLFKPKDNDMLLAMPIKRPVIVSARIIKFYVFEMLYCLIFLLPAMIAYAMNAEVGASYFLVAITMLVLMPIIPIAVSCIIGLVISAISGRFKHKTLLQVILSFVVMFVSIGLAFLISVSSDTDGHSMVILGNKINEFYYPAATFVNLATHFNILEYLIFVVINLAILALTVFLISRFCFRIITRLSTIKWSENTAVRYSFARHSQTSTMVRKELNRYFNTPVLLMNTAIGLVMFIIATVALCFNFDGIANSIVSSSEEFPLTLDVVYSYLPSITFAMVAFASLLTCITATMISLEGKAFNLLKTMPISGKKVIMTKVLASMILIVPVTVIGSIIMFARFNFGFLDATLILIAAVLLPLVTELIGILINLKYPRFDGETDAVVVKQSASVMVATFLGLGMVLVTISLVFAICFFVGQTVGLIMMNAIFIIIALFLYFAVATRGEEKYLKLTA